MKFSTVGSVGYIFSAITRSFRGENHFDPSPIQSSHARDSNSAVLKIYLKHEAQYQGTACRDFFQTGHMDLMVCMPLTVTLFKLPYTKRKGVL